MTSQPGSGESGREIPGTRATAGPPGAGQFLVIPAVDVIANEAVRLEQGDFDRVTPAAGDPAGLVSRYARADPVFIHVVDLDGARRGQIRPELVTRLAAAAGLVPIQASGGIRSLADAEMVLAAG